MQYSQLQPSGMHLTAGPSAVFSKSEHHTIPVSLDLILSHSIRKFYACRVRLSHLHRTKAHNDPFFWLKA